MGEIHKGAGELFIHKPDVLEARQMEECKDLSESDKGQIVMARCLGPRE